MLTIERLTYADIHPIWTEELWKDRRSEILPMSSMVNGGGIDLSIKDHYSPHFIGALEDRKVVGVLSGHSTSAEDFRFRGLFVYSEFRGRGIATELLFHLRSLAEFENRKCLWTFPRQESWPVYHKFGFTLDSPWNPGEIGLNAYASMRI